MVVWQLLQAMSACGPALIWKQASCCGKRAGAQRHPSWHFEQLSPRSRRT